MVITAGGPAFSIVAGIVFLLLARRFRTNRDLFLVFVMLGIANIGLGVGNLVPIEGSDGMKLFA